MKYFVLSLLILLSTSACENLPDLLDSELLAAGLSAAEQPQLSKGIKQALELGSTRAAQKLSEPGAYSASSLYHISLPQTLQPVAKRMRQFGLGAPLDKIESLMNQGAEKAAIEAKGIFVNAVRAMSVNDALGIIRGNSTAATDYFRTQTEASLRERYLPIIQENLGQIGFYDQYKTLLTTYNNLPISDKPNLDLEQHAVDQGLKALFSQVAKEEQLIRADPKGRGSDFIASVFSAN